MAANVEPRPHLHSPLSASSPSRALGRQAPPVSFKVLLSLSAVSWLFVTLTDVLYGYTMQINADQMFKAVVFINGNERVLQHVLLFPLLVACFGASLRIGWAPASHVLAQLLLGGTFSAISYYAMDLSEFLIWGSLMPRAVAALWTASFVTFFMTYCFGILLV